MVFDRFKGTSTDSEVALTTVGEIRDWLVGELSQRLGVEAGSIDPQVSLLDYGLDSFHATTLAGELGRRLKRKLSPVLLWDYPTIDSLSRFLAGEKIEPAAAPELAGVFADSD